MAEGESGENKKLNKTPKVNEEKKIGRAGARLEFVLVLVGYGSLTEGSSPRGRAQTRPRIHTINAYTMTVARGRGALINVCLAQ